MDQIAIDFEAHEKLYLDYKEMTSAMAEATQSLSTAEEALGKYFIKAKVRTKILEINSGNAIGKYSEKAKDFYYILNTTVALITKHYSSMKDVDELVAKLWVNNAIKEKGLDISNISEERYNELCSDTAKDIKKDREDAKTAAFFANKEDGNE